jgi:diketogulonate reductase-like aldo/keto reductase
MQLTLQSSVTLNNGVEIPRLGLGVYQTPPGELTLRAVRYALNIGYRHIDTAWLYDNERAKSCISEMPFSTQIRKHQH